MNGPLHRGSWKIGTIMEIPIRVHFSWFLVFGLISWSLSTYYFPEAAPDLPIVSHWIKGVMAALLLFVSVGLHELAHSVVARGYRIPIESITLFIFGGVAQMRGEPPHPKAEFRIAVAGPLASFFLAAVFYMLALGASGGVKALFSYLAQINLFIGVFNLMPGFPMDGGRVLRSILWEKTENFFGATQKASYVGQVISLIMIFFGVFSVVAGVPGGLWMMLIGWFLFTAANASYQQSTLQETLSGVKVEDIMVKRGEMVALNPLMTVDEAVNGFFLRHGYGGFPVIDGDRFLGMLTLKEVKEVPREAWERTKVAEAVVSHRKAWEIAGRDDAMKALEVMIREDQGRLAVVDDGGLAGLVTRNGIARYVQIKGK